MQSYQEEVNVARKWLKQNDGVELRAFINKIKYKSLIHSDNWSQIFDFVYGNYKDIPNGLVTGLTYLIEQEKIR